MKALSVIKKQAIGEILGIEIKCLHRRDDPMASDENHWCHTLLGGRFGEMLSHPVYLMQSVLGNDLQIDRIFTDKRGSYPWMSYDELHVVLQSEKGPGYIYVSFNAPRPATLVDIYSTEKILKIDLTNQTLIELGYRTLSKIDSARDCLGLSYKVLSLTIRNALEYLLRERGEYALRTIYTSFIDSIRKDKEPLITPKMAYNTVKTVEEICQRITYGKL